MNIIAASDLCLVLMFVQSYYYFNTYSNDHRTLKLLVRSFFSDKPTGAAHSES
jgi:hypothetical protein